MLEDEYEKKLIKLPFIDKYKRSLAKWAASNDQYRISSSNEPSYILKRYFKIQKMKRLLNQN